MLRGKWSNHQRDFYCLSCFNSYSTKNILKEHEELCNKHDSCRIEMSKWYEIILKCNPEEKLLKTQFTIFLDSECLLKKNNLVKTIQKNCTQRKKLGMGLLARQCLQNIYLIIQKINSIITEEGIALKNSVKS